LEPPSDLVLFARHGDSELEIDSTVSAVLNRHSIPNGDLDSDPKDKRLVHSLLAIWEDEKTRRREDGDEEAIEDTLPSTQERDMLDFSKRAGLVEAAVIASCVDYSSFQCLR